MAVQYDATGPGAQDNKSSGTLTLSWTHTPSRTDSLAIVVLVAVGKANNTVFPTATYGGVAMTTLGNISSGASSNGVIAMFGLLNPPTGARTVQVSLVLSGSTGMVANSVSYAGVAGFGTAATNNGTSSTPSVSVSNVPADAMTANLISGTNASVGTYNQTLRGTGNTNQSFVLWTAAIGDSSSSGSISFSTTQSSSGWAAVACPLLPAMPFLATF